MKSRASVEDIQRLTADHFDIHPGAMTSDKRGRRIARPRQVAMYLARTLTARSLPEIGRRFGHRDHTTVLHAVRTVTRMMKDDAAFAAMIGTLQDRIIGFRPGGFNLLSLGEWLAVARAARTPHVHARFVAQVAVDDLRLFEDREDQGRLMRLRDFFQAVDRAEADGHVMRWDHCAAGPLKAAMAQGGVSAPPPFVFTIDDPRAYDLLDDLPPSQAMMAAWRRPWVKARMIGGYPVEYRIFVRDGAITAVSSYYPQRPLPPTDLVEYEIRLACVYAQGMLAAIPTPIVNPQIAAAGIDPRQINCTLDFIATDRGVLFLEGGPPVTERWGAHPCCFEGRAVKGIALSPQGQVYPLNLAPHIHKAHPEDADALEETAA